MEYDAGFYVMPKDKIIRQNRSPSLNNPIFKDEIVFNGKISPRYIDEADRFIPLRNNQLIEKIQYDILRGNRSNYKKRKQIEYDYALQQCLFGVYSPKPLTFSKFKHMHVDLSKKLPKMQSINQKIDEHIIFDYLLDAPALINDYYTNILDWIDDEVVVIALDKKVYSRNMKSSQVDLLIETTSPIHSVKVNHEKSIISIGLLDGPIEIWDIHTLTKLQTFSDHQSHVTSLAWNEDILTSGSRSGNIYNFDIRSSMHKISSFDFHKSAICTIKWSPNNQYFASGGNDDKVCIWSFKRDEPYTIFEEHQGAVKAIAWSPHNSSVIASGGGARDKMLKIWNINNKQCINDVNTDKQICALVWLKYSNFILSADGYGTQQYDIKVWKYPKLIQQTSIKGHSDRILHLMENPSQTLIASASTDESIKIHKILQPFIHNKKNCKKQRMFALKNNLKIR